MSRVLYCGMVSHETWEQGFSQGPRHETPQCSTGDTKPNPENVLSVEELWQLKN